MSTQGLDSINSGVEVVTGLSHGFWSMVGLCIMVGVLYPHPWAYGSMLMLLGTAWYFLWMSFVRLEKTLTSCERQLVVPHKRYVPLSLPQRVFLPFTVWWDLDQVVRHTEWLRSQRQKCNNLGATDV